MIMTALKALNFKQQGHVQISKGENRKINSNHLPVTLILLEAVSSLNDIFHDLLMDCFQNNHFTWF